MLATTSGITLGLKNIKETSSEDEYFFTTMRRIYKCTRGHKRSVYKYSLHVNNCLTDQEKQSKTVARRKLITNEA